MPDRIQREVEELLTRLDTLPPRKRPLSERLGAPFRGLRNAFSGVAFPRLSAGHVLLAAMVIVAVGVIVGDAKDLWRWVVVGGVFLFIGAFIFSLRRQSRPPEKYWRDRPMDTRPSGGSFWDRWRGRH
jgi:hypothetical protein